MVAIFLDHGAAARGVHHDGFDRAAFHQRPPGIDIAFHVGQRAVVVGEMLANGAAATGAVGQQRLHANGIEHAGGGRADIGHERGLHAAAQHQHFAGVVALWAFACALPGRHLVAQRGGHQRAQRLAELDGRGEQAGGHAFAQRPAGEFFSGGTFHLGIDHGAADVHQTAVFHPGRAGGLAVAAGQAAVEVQLGGAGGRLAFERLFDLVDAAARAVELIAQQLIGGAGGGAKAAVHAVAQNGFGLLAFGRAGEFGAEMGFHRDQKRVGNTPCGSKAALTLR